MSVVSEYSPFRIGQTVYIPWANAYCQKIVPCPICYGQRLVTLILGSGEHVRVECQGCDREYEGSVGTVFIQTPNSGVHAAEVSGFERTSSGWRITAGTYSLIHADELFADLASAELRRATTHTAAETQAQQNFESQFKLKRKTHGWTVQYHRNGEVPRVFGPLGEEA